MRSGMIGIFKERGGNIQTLITFHAGTHPRFQMEQTKEITATQGSH